MDHRVPGPQELMAGGPIDGATPQSADEVGVAVYDRQGRPCYLNDAFCRLVGISREGLLDGASPFRHWAGPSVLPFGSDSDADGSPAIDGAARLYSGAYRYPDGGLVPVGLAVLPLSPEGAGSCTVLLEVRAAAAGTGRHAAALRSRVSGDGALRGELLAEVTAHECNNILAVIRLVVVQAMASPALAPELVPLLERIRDASERGAAIARTILRPRERLQAALAESDIDAHIRSLGPVLAETAGAAVRVQLDLAAGDRLVSFDPVGLDSVLINLVANARNAMPAGGAVTISSRAPADAARAPGPGGVELRISDEGVGMPFEVLVRALNPGFTTSADTGGTGLGLSTTRELMQGMGGEVLIESAQGRGTTVTLRLRASAPASEPEPEPEPEPAARSTRLLVVEDDATLRELAALVLVAEGYEVTTAGDAGQALELLERCAFDLMFSDVLLPGGMDGTELAELAGQRWPRMRTLLSSGYMEHAVSGSRNWQVLPKPYDPAMLLREVARVLKAGDAVED